MTPIPTAGRGRYPGPAGVASAATDTRAAVAGLTYPQAGGTHETARASSI